MSSIFPGSPSINDIFTSNGTTWQWNGEAWVVVAQEGQTFNTVITSPSSQTITADSGTDTLTIAAGTNISVSANSSNDTLTINSTIDTQGLINTASAAAYGSASAYIDSEINALTTSDIEEGSNLYFTNQRAIDAASATYIPQTSESTIINTASAAAYSSASAYTDSEIAALQVFSSIATSPSTQIIQGDSNSDTLTLISGENITISADSSTDSITINSTGNYTSVDSISYPDYIVFDTTPENTSASTSTLAWDAGEGGLGIQLNANTQVTLGQEIIVLCNNGEATTLDKGEVVRLSGASGQRPQVTRAYNTGDAGSALTFGIVAESIASGAEGFVVTQGVVKNINTNAYNEGDILYLSASAGQVTTVKPQAPNHYVFVGVVTKKNAVSGRIYVKPQNGYELEELHDVRITSVQGGDIIIWNSASTLWMNEPLQNYLTSASVSAFNAASANTLSQINALTTTDIEEGSNLYFTNQRAIDAASATYILQADQQSIINTASGAAVTYLVDGAPGALDTLNELAAALNDDASFATTVTNSLAAKLDSSTASATYLTITDASATYVAQNATGDEYIQDKAAQLLDHAFHVNASATYDDGNNRIIITANAGGGGGAAVEYQASQPDVTSLDPGTLWIDSDQDVISGLLPATFTRWVKVLSASATTISGLDDNALSLIYIPGYEKVFINGTLLVRGSDYTATTGNTVVLTVAGESTDVVEIHAYEAFQIADTYTQGQIDSKFNNYTRWSKTYSASATTITGADDYANALSYTNNYERVFINGVLVDPSEYTRTSASVITPDEAILSGDVVEVFNIVSAQIGDTYTTAQIDAKYNNRTRWTKTYSASATVISGADDNANSLSYTSGNEEVYLNGILLTPVTDYARTSASVITLNSAVVTNDIIDVVNISPFNVANVYSQTESDNKYLTQSSASSTYAPVAAGGLIQIVPTSIATTGGSATSSISSTGAVSFASASAISLNGCFSSTYDNYRLMISLSAASADTYLYARLRASGSDISTSNYNSAVIQAAFGSTTLGNDNGGTSQSTWNRFGWLQAGTLALEIPTDIGSPYLSRYTSFSNFNSRSGYGHQTAGGTFNATTVADGITIYPLSGTISGIIRVYGYRN